MLKKTIINFCLFLLTTNSIYSQSNFEKILKGGELVITGINVYNKLKVNDNSSKKETTNELISSICVKNKIGEKITFKLFGKDKNNEEINKELIIQSNGKECLFEILKGIYSYEVILCNKDIFQKGEFNIEEEIDITIKKE